MNERAWVSSYISYCCKFYRVLEGYPPFVVVVNLGDDTEHANLAVDGFENISDNLVVYLASINSQREEGFVHINYYFNFMFL